MGIFTISLTFIKLNQGDLLDVILVQTILDWWRAMVLKISVAQFARIGRSLSLPTTIPTFFIDLLRRNAKGHTVTFLQVKCAQTVGS
jgi:hypothetical protein